MAICKICGEEFENDTIHAVWNDICCNCRDGYTRQKNIEQGEIYLSTAKELCDKVNSGEIDQSKLQITTDNDFISVYYGDLILDPVNKQKALIEPKCIHIEEFDSWRIEDILKILLKLLFPKSKIDVV